MGTVPRRRARQHNQRLVHRCEAFAHGRALAAVIDTRPAVAVDRRTPGLVLVRPKKSSRAVGAQPLPGLHLGKCAGPLFLWLPGPGRRRKNWRSSPGRYGTTGPGSTRGLTRGNRERPATVGPASSLGGGSAALGVGLPLH